MKIIRFLAVLAVLIAAAGLASYWWAGKDFQPLDDDARAKLKSEGLAHDFATLSQGTVHYRLEGPQDGPVVVLVHGFSVPSFVWNDHIKPLVSAGFRVLAFDNYGRGFSDRPEGRFDVERTDRLLTDLLEELAINEKVHMVGYSLGSAATAEFASRHPEKLRSIILIAPAALSPDPDAGRLRPLLGPVIGDWIMRVLGNTLIADEIRTTFEETPAAQQHAATYERQLEFSGYRRALLSTLRHYPIFDGVADAYGKIGLLDIPVTTIWAEEDARVKFTQLEVLKGLIPEAAIISFPHFGHSMTYAHPKEVNGAILDHFRNLPLK